jgi:hypothetical protein
MARRGGIHVDMKVEDIEVRDLPRVPAHGASPKDREPPGPEGGDGVAVERGLWCMVYVCVIDW